MAGSNKKKRVITIPMQGWTDLTKLTDNKLKAAAKKVIKDINKHFNPKTRHGWPLGYSFYVSEVFYQAYGVHLEGYLLQELSKVGKYELVSGDHGLVIQKAKLKRKKK